MSTQTQPHLLRAVPPSPTLAADQRMRERIAAGQPVVHLALAWIAQPLAKLGAALSAAA